MKHVPIPGATQQRLPRSDVSRARPAPSTPPSIPRWVKVLVIAALVLFVLFALARFTVVPYLHHLSGHDGVRAPTPFISLLVSGGHLS